MVLFKRKPVQYLPRPTIEDDSSEVWVIPETNEVFTSYESYLHRRDFYKQRRFICEITGHSGLTFFEALQSEMAESRELNSAFPDALKEPILRRVQFSTVSRVDHLVDEIFEEFKQDFYPGEQVTTVLEDNTRLHGIIRDKMNFPRQYYPDGGVKSEAYARYLVRILDRPNEEALLDQDHITRDRKTFSKQMLRAFIKNNTTRESWNGAPWLVKPTIAEEYKIDTEVPKHLHYGARVAEKKAMKKADQEGHFGFFSSKKLPELKPATGNAPKTKLTPQELARNKAEQFLEYQRSLNGDPSFLVAKEPGVALPRHLKDVDVEKRLPIPAVVVKTELPPVPVIKYPIEDLDIKYDPTRPVRPKFKLGVDSIADISEDGDLLQDEITPESASHFLETWNTLNVYCEVFQLDSFTFDDFVEAIRFSSEDTDCELFVEVHCAVLKKLVNAINDDDGAIQVSLPDLPQDTSDESGSEEEEGEEEEPTPEPEPVVTRMTTRSSLAKAEAAHIQSQLEIDGGEDTGKPRVHRAAELFERCDWIDRLRKRDFRNGGWELIMAGLFNQLSIRPKMEEVCEEILKHLVPLDTEPSRETVRSQYATLNVNLRIRALQIICMLSLETKAIRNYLEECSNQMTEFRKEKIEHQRARKSALEELRKLHVERKEHEPEPEKEDKDKENDKPKEKSLDDETLDSVLAANIDDDVDTDEVMDTEDDNPRGPSLRGGMDRIMDRKRRRDAERERREQLAKQPKGSKQYQKILKKIDDVEARIATLEDEIAVVDNDLREADCPRTRCLGKDRFCNRYWWFERNGMPYEGLPNSSTADAKYANGRLWVQGPDDMEREGFLEPPESLKKIYVKEHRVSPAERKSREEGGTSLPNARHWAYYDEPSQLDDLIKWLDTRGLREIRLRKELQLQRGYITKHMQYRNEYLTRVTERAESEDIPAKRMSTRTKTFVDDRKHRCLRWRNTTALSENGHLHVDAARLTKRAKRATDDAKELKTISKQGKSLSRQGSRYKI